MKQKQNYLRRCTFLWASLVLFIALLLAACGTQIPSSATTVATAPPTAILPTPASTRPAPTTASSPVPPPATPPATVAGTPVGTLTPTIQAQLVPPTPACTANLNTTPSQTEGPYYKPNTPERASLLEPGITGTKLVLTGYVLTRDCKPIAHALLDFWQADDKGEYDNTGYKLRGHLFTDATGRYTLETIVPGLYPGRTRHIHVKVQAPNQSALTTQLYFPAESRNQSDTIFNRDLLANVQDSGNGKRATFNFVLNVR